MSTIAFRSLQTKPSPSANSYPGFRDHRAPTERPHHAPLPAQEAPLPEHNAHVYWMAMEHFRAELVQTQAALDRFECLLAQKDRQIAQLTQQLKTMLDARQTMDENNSPEHDFHQVKILTDKDWNSFQEHFDQRFPGLLRHLKQSFPNITAAETRLFLLTKLDFDVKEIANGLGISVESVWRTRHRLAKKIGLTDTRLLDEIIHQFK